MSNSHLLLKSGFLRAPLQNGLGRFVPQLQRITLKFCKTHGSSKGLRFVVGNHIKDITLAFEFYLFAEILLNTDS